MSDTGRLLDSLRLDGRVALVTGAGRGIGRAIALALADVGATLCLTSRTQAELDDVSREVRERFGTRALTVVGDQSVRDDVERVVRTAETELGGIDILVNNAGQPVESPLLEMSEEAVRAIVDVNLLGPIRYLQAAGPGMVARHYGKVINVSSMDAFIGTPNLSVYGATKGGIAQLTKALAAEWSRHGIYVNAMCPGFVHTAANKYVLADQRVLDKVLRRIPLRRVGQPEDLGVLAVYLASPASDFVTGACFPIDGGETAV